MSDVIGQSIAGQEWGVCGFVSVLNALHEQGKLEEFGNKLSTPQIQERLGAEIITYLKMTEVDRPAIADAILDYTQSFGDAYKNYTSITDICNRIKAQLTNVRTLTDWYKLKNATGIALPPSAVQDYIRWAGLQSTLETLPDPSFTPAELRKYKNCIVGCGRDPKAGAYHGLRHWVYVDQGGRLLNWGVRTDLNTSPLPQEVIEKKYGYIPCVVRLQ